MKQIKFFLNNQSLPIALILFTCFIIYRIFVLSSIHSQRDLPIEVDDAYVYISQSSMFYNNHDRKKQTTQSIQSITNLTFEKDISNDIQNLAYYDAPATSNRYFLYSATFGFFTEILKFDPITVWWSFSYVTQIFIALSIFLMISLYVSSNLIVFIIASMFGAFISIEIVHQIMATPLSIANSLLLIGWYCLNKNNKTKILSIFGIFLITLALHTHPATFVILGLLSSSSLVFWYFNFESKQKHRNIFLISFCSVLLILTIEFLYMILFNGERYLSVIGDTTFAKSRNNMGIIEIIYYNYSETFGRLKDFSDLYSFKNLGIVLFILSLFVTFKLNKKIFIINIIFLLGNVVGLIHYFPYHRGEMIEYTGQAQTIFMAIAFSYLYFRIIKFATKNKEYKFIKLAIMLIFFIFIFNKFQSTNNQIDSRISRHNFINITPQIKEFVENLPKNTSLIVGDQFVYLMLLSEITDRSILLANHLRIYKKPWAIPLEFPPPSAYIGIPLEKVKVGEMVYNLENYDTSKRIIFSNIKSQ